MPKTCKYGVKKNACKKAPKGHSARSSRKRRRGRTTLARPNCVFVGKRRVRCFSSATKAHSFAVRKNLKKRGKKQYRVQGPGVKLSGIRR